MWLLDVRPMELVKEEDALKFAAAREVAAACGRRYSVVAGWRPHVWSVLDHLSSRRRPTRDLLGMRDQLLTAVGDRAGGAMTFSDALSVIAADAISIISGERDGKLALCASPTCQAAFFDTSQSRTRKWCDMNTCGNRQKKARFNANQRKNPRSAE